MENKRTKGKYIITTVIITLISFVLGFPLSAVFHAIFATGRQASFSDIFLYWIITSTLVWLILFGLSLLLMPWMRDYYKVLSNKNSKDIEMIQMIGTNQAFDTSIISGIIHNQTEYTVKITYKNGTTAVKKVSGKWLNKNADLIKI